MENITCDFCNKEIKSNKDFIAVMQFYPKFPYSKFHTSCYSEFLKNRFWVVSPGGNLVISGKNGTRGVIAGCIGAALFEIFAFTAVFPRISPSAFTNVFALFFALVVPAFAALIIFLRMCIYYNFEKTLA